MDKRNESIDVLRWIALTGIILVHSEPSLFWAQLRSFDVPLMVILSAVVMTFGGGKITNRIDYYKRRFIRLVFPSWIFLTFYFLIQWLIEGDCHIKKIIMCYTLTTSWYFWIIRILVVMAILAPFLIQTREMSKNKLIMLCIVLLSITEILTLISENYYYTIWIMFIPYVVYYILGINLNRFSEVIILYTGLALFVLYAIMAIFLFYESGSFVLTGDYKYPPRFFYTSYALGSSALLWYYRKKIVAFLEVVKIKNFALFVGSHTFWIYLWHIPIVDKMAGKYNAVICFITAYSISIILSYTQNLVVEKYCNSLNNKDVSKYVKMIFVG